MDSDIIGFADCAVCGDANTDVDAKHDNEEFSAEEVVEDAEGGWDAKCRSMYSKALRWSPPLV